MTPIRTVSRPPSAPVPAFVLAILLMGPLAPARAADHGAADHAPPKVAKVAKAATATMGVSGASGASGVSGVSVASGAIGDEAVPPKVATAPVDPLEQLRLRLAERLSSGKAVETTSPNDLRVVAKPAAAGPAGRATAAVQAAGHGAAKPAAKVPEMTPRTHAHAQAPPWAYSGSAGPAAWGAMQPEFSACAAGQRQSPIDIRGGLAVDLDPVRFDYQASRFGVVDNGHTVQVNLAQGNTIEVGGKRFELLQFHFHRPAEERIDGRHFEMSLHLVHKDDQGRLAVVALLFDKGQPQAVVQKVWNNLPLERHQENEARGLLELADLLPADRRYFTYMGSLTTPPCSEGVQWIVLRQPLTLTPEQIDIFARIYPMNARPLQAASGRRIMQSN